MGGLALRSALLATAFIAAASGSAAGVIDRLTLTVPPGFEEVASGQGTREWAPSRPSPEQPTRVVVLERERESWDEPTGVLKRLHRLLKENCPRAGIEYMSRPVPDHADAAARAVLSCPTHDASGRGLVVVEDVIAVGERFIIVKLAFDFPPFSAGVKPMSRGQRSTAFATLDSFRLVASPPRVLPP